MKRLHNEMVKNSNYCVEFESFCKQFAYNPSISPVATDKKDDNTYLSQDSINDEEPFVAPYPFKYRDKFSTPCDTCFEKCIVCHHNSEKRLRLLIIGHNPSDHSWKSGNMYSNPTNRMWKILTGTLLDSGDNKRVGIISKTLPISKQNSLPDNYGIGFCDMYTAPGSNSTSFSQSESSAFNHSLYDRLKKHLQRVCKQQHNDSTCSHLIHSPQIVIFSGKKQYASLLGRKSGVLSGLQKTLPVDWPFSNKCKVYVCPSTSGRVVMKKEDLLDYYEQAFDEYRKIELSVFLINNK